MNKYLLDISHNEEKTKYNIYLDKLIKDNINNRMNSTNPKSLLVIGNGFDLFLGLRSSFTEFLNSYMSLNNAIKDIINYLQKIDGKYYQYTYKNNTITGCLIIQYLCNIPISNNPSIPPVIGRDTRKGIEDDQLFEHLTNQLKKFISTKIKTPVNFWILYLFLKKNEKKL